ncbi:MAG TPA: LPS export ABC transporter permease LptG, partial [Paracoccaceae bacterium]|nr:LPS export ABC transporter permease LptG [Paracoccaceae bacterium]
VELIRRGGDSGASFGSILSLALLHMLPVASATFPFVFMLSAMACFLRLARASELVVTRAAGVSVWNLLLPAVLCAAFLGVAAFAILNPISAAMLQRFETLEARYLKGQESLLSISREGLWLRQAGPEGQSVIRARHANGSGTELFDVTFFRFGRQNELLGRIEAREAVLGDRAWRLSEVRDWIFDPAAPEAPPRLSEAAELDVPTDLTSDRILESFAAPDAIGFWDLPEFIDTLEGSGFATQRHQMHFQSELAKPLLFAAMVLIGAAFSMRHVRFGGIGWMLLGATLTGFALFFLSDITQALGASGAIPTLIAAWVPPTAATLLALGLLLHLEDG